MFLPLDVALNQVDWQSVEPPTKPTGLPYPTHSGILRIGDFELQAFVLNTGERVFSEESIKKFFGMEDAP